MNRSIIILIIISSFLSSELKARDRPFIWVNQSEREVILQKIDSQAWAASFYESFIERLNLDFSEHQNDPVAFLEAMALNMEAAQPGISPPLKTVDYNQSGGSALADVHMRYLQVGIDCGIVYFLTQDERYAQCATDILNAFIQGLLQITPSTELGNGGWLYPGDHLREVREIGGQIPIIYDFISPFILQGGMPYDLGKAAKTEFPQELAQSVFRTYVNLAIDHGQTGSNWSVLESPCMVHNLLALEDESDRDAFLQVYLTEGSSRQDPLSVVANNFKQEGDVYPETSQYSNGVAFITTNLITILTKYDPSLHLGQKYANIPLALSRWEDMKYPNNDIVRFGDGHRYSETNYGGCEAAYILGQLDSVPDLVEKNGILINTAINEGKYNRGNLGGRPLSASTYFQPLSLLWFANEIEGDVEHIEPTRTDNMRHASLFLQRNLSETGKPEDGLMCFVAGAAMVHGHASGMDMELYGKGHVLGVDNGRGSYRTDIHENYSRIFAAHNSVIVNGNSSSSGEWVNLGINPVTLVSMEPMPKEAAVSPDFSFTQTSFLDNKGDKAEATQLRTMVLVRTSPTTGYYWDMFRSKSVLPNQYHDYLYHNIGDKLEFLNGDMQLNATPNRFMANANLPWVQNRSYRHPGWHYFEDVKTSPVYEKDVKTRFVAEQLGTQTVYMNMYISGNEEREYTSVLAPKTFEAPSVYSNKKTPTLVMRQTGEAWDHPFMVVYEPTSNDSSSIVSVYPIYADDKVVGSEVRSLAPGTAVTDYIISLNVANDILLVPNLNLRFEGRFGIVRVEQREEQERVTLYIGDGKSLSFGEDTLTLNSTKKGLKIIGELPPYIEEKGTGFSIEIEAEDYDEGGEGVAYHDFDVGNSGGAYRDDDVDIVASSTASNGYAITHFKGKDWMNYTFQVDSSLNYVINYVASCRNKDDATVNLYIDEELLFGGNTHVERTYSHDVYGENHLPDSVFLEKGTHVLKVYQTMSLAHAPDKIHFTHGEIGSVVDNVSNIRSDTIPNTGFLLGERFELNITANNGSVTRSIEDSIYKKGAAVVLEAIPEEGFQFDSWSGDAQGSDNPLTITMNIDMNITANFIMITGSPDFANSLDYTVYPNPSQGKFKVKMSGESNGIYSVYNLAGVLETHGILSETFEFDISSKPRGIYILKFITDKKLITEKIVLI